jgi:hypothetical protein
LNLLEELDAGNPQAGFCEGCAPQGARLLDEGSREAPPYPDQTIKNHFVLI